MISKMPKKLLNNIIYKYKTHAKTKNASTNKWKIKTKRKNEAQ